MRRLLPAAVFLETLGLGIWLGGMIAIGPIVASTVFGTVTPAAEAGEVMSTIFRKFNGGLVYVCIALAVAGYLLKLAVARVVSRRLQVEGALLALLVASGLYIGALLGPRMQELRQLRIADPQNTTAVVEFDRGHRRSRALFSVNMLLSVVLLYLTAAAPAATVRSADEESRGAAARV
jgi:uncharacterized membrane protein